MASTAGPNRGVSIEPSRLSNFLVGLNSETPVHRWAMSKPIARDESSSRLYRFDELPLSNSRARLTSLRDKSYESWKPYTILSLRSI
jgi:hypothetical protein